MKTGKFFKNDYLLYLSYYYHCRVSPDIAYLSRIVVIWCAIVAFYKQLHRKFPLSFTLNEQILMGNAAVSRLNIMNFLLEPDVDFGFDLKHLPHAQDQTWLRFTVRKLLWVAISLLTIQKIHFLQFVCSWKSFMKLETLLPFHLLIFKNLLMKWYQGPNHLPTYLMADFYQDINRVFSFSRHLDGTFLWKNSSIKALVH